MPLRRWKGSCDGWCKETYAAVHGPGMQQSFMALGCFEVEERMTKVKSFCPEIVCFQHCKEKLAACVRRRNAIFALGTCSSELLGSSAHSQTCRWKQNHALS